MHVNEKIFQTMCEQIQNSGTEDQKSGTKDRTLDAIVESMNTIYDADVVKIGPDHEPLVGLDAVVASEHEYFDSFSTVKFVRAHLLAVLPDENKTIVHFDYAVVDSNGTDHYWDQISVQEWRNGKVFREKAWWDTRQSSAWAPEEDL